MYGSNMYGMSGGMGGGSSEMIIVVLCCICCICLSSVFAGYFFNIFCGISSSLGKSCSPAATSGPVLPTGPQPTYKPSSSSSVQTCSQQYEGQARAANDPRPPINANACTNADRQTGSDCFYWTTVADNLTGQAKWVRVTDTAQADSRNAACSPTVNCPLIVDFNSQSMAGYTDNNAAPLLTKCTPVRLPANTAGSIASNITKVATSSGVIHRSTSGSVAWTPSMSTLWTNVMKTQLQGRDYTAAIVNTGTATLTVKAALGQTTIDTATFAGMLEAAITPSSNDPAWIVDTVNLWKGQIASTSKYGNEAGLIAFIQTVGGRRLQNWINIINSPAALANQNISYSQPR